MSDAPHGLYTWNVVFLHYCTAKGFQNLAWRPSIVGGVKSCEHY